MGAPRLSWKLGGDHGDDDADDDNEEEEDGDDDDDDANYETGMCSST